ncbi:type IV secretion protein Rhs [Chryseobacterium sp. Y16C]|uniref:RHS repeat-associated core domain-containing protein n=1 Tax=Chryseobacterium sp. Y16C TaxID=2920939 RepID=UPI001F0A20C8|nr:RHS repeat-associated core domain-containing protein [Chryseobacterium sp. Y16C]UMQ43054.1 type IV secretion protein Rhs [Chryseobacterium sp. Y16C]
MRKYYQKKIELFSSVLLSFISALCFSQTPPKFHDTKGNIEVNKSGQLQYTLNIDLPPGVKEVAPNISLVYSSGGQNGLAGYNWNILGLSSISRTGKNLEKDGITKGVQLDYTDYYSFNGQRLILKSGEYGKDGAQYVSEKYSNVKIKSIGSVSGVSWQGPEFWEVTFDDGSQAWYGAIATGNSSGRSPIDYNIVKSKDTNGNIISYNYVLDGNVSLISSILWGGNENAGTQPKNKIDFVFGARAKPEKAFIRGVAFTQTKLLQSIVVSTNNKQYKKYNVSYKKDAQGTNYSYLDKITVLNSKDEEANPVIFEYDSSPNWTNESWLSLNATTTTSLRPNKDTDVVGDFDGDGKLDMLRYFSVTNGRIPQPGVYLFRDFYSKTYESESPQFINSSLQSLKDFIPSNFKKSNIIKNRQGIIGFKKVNNPSTSKKDLQLSFYSLSDTGNTLVLDFSKTVPNIDTFSDDPNEFEPPGNLIHTILGLDNFDFNGDGLNELVLQMNFNYCTPGTIDPNPTFPNDGTLKPPGTVCENLKKYVLIDPDESIQNDDWHYTIDLYPDTNEDVFKTYRSGDFNGDGIFDFLKLDQNKKPLLITFQKNQDGKYESSINYFNPTGNEIIEGAWDYSTIGDFNGDGLSDIMLPQSGASNQWNKYTSKGIGFEKEVVTFLEPRGRNLWSNGQNFEIKNPRTFVSYDINNDGKAEVLALESIRGYYYASVQDNNQNAKYGTMTEIRTTFWSPTGGEYTTDGYYEHFTQYRVDSYSLYLNSGNIDAEFAVNYRDMIGLPVNQWAGAMLRKMVMVSAVTSGSAIGDQQRLVSHPYYDIARAGRIKNITQGGITTTVTYKQLDKEVNPGLYDAVQTESYPYVEINQSTGMFVVSQLRQSTTTDKVLKQDFRYRGLTSNILGRGMIGFRRTASSSWYADGLENTKIWSGLEIDPVNEGVPVKEWSIRTNIETNIFPADISENNSQLLSFKSTTYQTDKILNGQVISSVADADKAKVVTAILPKTIKAKDFLTNTLAENSNTYGTYYLPAQTISKINTSFAIKTTQYEYDHNPAGIGNAYYIGRLKSKTESVQAYLDTKNDKEEYTYENNRIKTLKKWNWDNTAYTLDTFTYDDFGNIKQKVSTNSIDSQTITSGYVYDATGRFLEKQIDNLGLETISTFGDWGQQLTNKDPFNNLITNSYDDWGKLLTSTKSLGGTTSYLYEKDGNSNVTVTQNDADGNIVKKLTNKLGQLYKSTTKSYGQGQYVSQEIQYDALGRKIKESEPYFEGQSADKWNTIVYDDSVYPAKATSTAFTGKQLETIVSGLTTTVKETNLSDNGRITIKTADALGNIISSTDKGGTIQYLYNAAGQQIQAKFGENVVLTKYDTWGRKSEFNDPSNGVYKYEYDGFGRIRKTISPKGEKENIYNNLGQVITQKEFSTIDSGQTTNKTITLSYGTKGLLSSKSGVVKGQSFSTTITYDTYGRMISTVENSFGKTYSQKGLIYDDKGRISSYEKEVQSSGLTTKVTIENIYSPWNGALSQIKDKISGKILWELKEVNAKGQAKKSNLGATEINNGYDANGYLSNINHSSAAKPGILQISYSFDAIKNELKTRTTGGDFSITEFFDYDDNNRLVNWTDPVTGIKPMANRNVFDVKGRIQQNDQIGTVKFENPSKIYQPSGMTLNSNGVQNYNGDLIQTVIYNENNDPVQINGEKDRVSFDYGLGNMRQRVDIIKLKNPVSGGDPPISEFKTSDYVAPVWQNIEAKFYSEDNSFEVIRNQNTDQEKHIIYIEGTPYESNVIYLKDFGQTAGGYKFLHKDYLGSILAISDEAGNKLEQRHFDAWGNFTHLKIGSSPIVTDKNSIIAAVLLIDRGYTGHEHFMNVGIVHMNGRLYDPLLRRFLNADENIQDPSNTQNYNKYGYVLNNPMMYSDPNGEIWFFIAGALIGGYLNGVAANHGNWNPIKWDWQNTWGAVVGGAVGGAAISGAFGNIAINPGAIKTVLPGIVSGGLSSAFTGSNFLSGIASGISYSANLFNNKITSTDAVSIGYKYIVSPEENSSGGGWEDLTKSILLNYVKTNFCVSCSYGKLQQKAGKMFESAFNSIMGLDLASFNYTGNDVKIAGLYKGRPRNTVPDGVFDLVRDEIKYRTNDLRVGPFNIRIPIPNGLNTLRFYGVQYAEVKAMDGTLYTSSNQGQLEAMITSMHMNRGVSTYGGQFMIGTTSDTVISPNIYTLGASFGKSAITILHMTSQYRMISGEMQVRFIQGWMSSPTSSTYLK